MRLIERLVAAVNAAPREPRVVGEIPARCAPVAHLASEETNEWQIVAAEPAVWVDGVERRTGFAFPSIFRDLIAAYHFPRFTCGGIELYAVGLDEHSVSYESAEFRSAIFFDRALVSFLLARRIVPFARVETGSYDPVCFDFRTTSAPGRAPIVRVDHEDVLSRDRVGTPRRLAPSFEALVRGHLESSPRNPPVISP